jgi:WhiB family redox-sensing transcriptional regulator
MDVAELDMVQAACKETDTDLFFPEPGAGYANAIVLAKAICEGCPIKADCLQVALDNNYEGVWGGMTTLDRENFKRRMRRANRGRIHESALPKIVLTKKPQRAHLVAANAKRAQNSAAKSVEVVSRALAALGDDVPESLRKAGQARLDNPTFDLQQLADMLGVTKDSYAGSIRRLVKLASK